MSPCYQEGGGNRPGQPAHSRRNATQRPSLASSVLHKATALANALQNQLFVDGDGGVLLGNNREKVPAGNASMGGGERGSMATGTDEKEGKEQGPPSLRDIGSTITEHISLFTKKVLNPGGN